MPHSAVQQFTAPTTISAPEVARITGVGRERLRTWERRHGFPSPVRTPNGVRRYLASDVRRIVAVARAVEAGVPVADAIREELASPTLGVTPPPVACDRALEQCSEAVLVVAGPAPIRVAWANGITMRSPDAPQVGDDLGSGSVFSGVTLAEIQDLMQSTGEQGRVLDVQDWTRPVPRTTRALAWRLTPTVAEEPTVVLMQLPPVAATTQAAAPDLTATTSWTRACGEVRAILRAERGLSSVQRALAALLRTTGGVDGFLAVQRPDSLRAATSVTGALQTRVVPRVEQSELDRAVRDDTVTWLSEHAASALRTPTRTRTLVVPLAAGGDHIGALFLVYPDVLDTPSPVPELLLAIGLAITLTLQREHLAAAATTRLAA